jgi:hypothetical protein
MQDGVDLVMKVLSLKLIIAIFKKWFDHFELLKKLPFKLLFGQSYDKRFYLLSFLIDVGKWVLAQFNQGFHFGKVVFGSWLSDNSTFFLFGTEFKIKRGEIGECFVFFIEVDFLNARNANIWNNVNHCFQS